MVAIAVRLVGPEMLFCSQQGCEKDVGIVLILLHETARTAMAASAIPPRTRTKVGRG